MTSEAGKGDTYRPVDRTKYDLGYLRVFGILCSKCQGCRQYQDGTVCKHCNGIGYVAKGK